MQEPLAAGRVVGVLVEDLLQRHLAVQLRVQGDEDGAQAAAGVGPQDAEPLAVGGGRADGVAGRCGRRRRRRVEPEPSWVRVRSIVGVAERGQALAGGPAGGDRGQALLDVAAVLLRGAAPTRPRRRRGASASRSPRATRWSASGRGLSGVQAWKAATSWTWSIRPFWRASRPKSRSRSAAMAAMGQASREAGAGSGRSAPDAGGLRGCAPDRLDYLMMDRPMQPRRGRSNLPRVRLPRGSACGALEQNAHC